MIQSYPKDTWCMSVFIIHLLYWSKYYLIFDFCHTVAESERSATGNLFHFPPIYLLKSMWKKYILWSTQQITVILVMSHIIQDHLPHISTSASFSGTRLLSVLWQEKIELLWSQLYPTLLLVHYPSDTKRQWTVGRSISSIAPSHTDPYETSFNCIGSTIDPSFSAAVNFLLSVLPCWSITSFNNVSHWSVLHLSKCINFT